MAEPSSNSPSNSPSNLPSIDPIGSEASSQYSYAAVQEILKLAIARQGLEDEGFSRSQLQEIAEEMGVSNQALGEAEATWQRQHRWDSDRQAFDSYRRGRFQQHAVKYIIINGSLLLLDHLMGPGMGLSSFIAVVWGMGLGLDAQQAYLLQGDRYEQRFRSWQQRRFLKQSVNSIVQRLFSQS